MEFCEKGDPGTCSGPARMFSASSSELRFPLLPPFPDPMAEIRMVDAKGFHPKYWVKVTTVFNLDVVSGHHPLLDRKHLWLHFVWNIGGNLQKKEDRGSMKECLNHQITTSCMTAFVVSRAVFQALFWTWSSLFDKNHPQFQVPSAPVLR